MNYWGCQKQFRCMFKPHPIFGSDPKPVQYQVQEWLRLSTNGSKPTNDNLEYSIQPINGDDTSRRFLQLGRWLQQAIQAKIPSTEISGSAVIYSQSVNVIYITWYWWQKVCAFKMYTSMKKAKCLCAIFDKLLFEHLLCWSLGSDFKTNNSLSRHGRLE